MNALRRVAAAVLAIISVAVAIHSIVGEIYSVYWSDSHLLWDYLNWFIALAMLVALVFHFRRKRAFDRRNRDEDVTLGYLSTNFLLFATMFLALWFFANWFEELNSGGNTPGTVVGFVWIGFNASFVVLAAVTAWLLWNTEEGSRSGEVAAPAGDSPAGTESLSPTGSPVIPSETPGSSDLARSGAGVSAAGAPSGGILNMEESAGSLRGR